MKEPLSGTTGKWATFKASWKASKRRYGPHDNPTLYSTERLARWLPLKFLTAVPVLLSLSVFYNAVFLFIGIEGLISEWYNGVLGLVQFLAFCGLQLILFPWSCADLHKRRKHRLRPKRIIITAGSALFFLVIALSFWSWAFFRSGPLVLYRGYGPFGIDLSFLLPFLAMLDTIFYAVYLSIGLVAMIRDYKITPPDEVHTKYVDDGLPRHATPIDPFNPELTSQGEDTYTRLSSTYDSSIAQISCQTSMTMQQSTGVSTSLVTASSVRSSAIISSNSSQLPAYSGRSSATHSQRHSTEEPTHHEFLSRLEQAHLRS